MRKHNNDNDDDAQIGVKASLINERNESSDA